MKKASKLTFSTLLIASILVLSVAPAFAGGPAVSLDYVAFGDSVASGVRGGVKELCSDCGYTDLIAQELKAAGALGFFSEDFCTSGMTAKLLAAKTAVLNDKSSAGCKLVKNAEIATLTIGGNDLLAPLYAYIKTLGSGQLPDADKLSELLSKVADSVYDGTTAPSVEADIETILRNILNANPNIKIYVMGYYNPLPVAAALTGIDLNTPLKDFNVYIKKAITDVTAKNAGASVCYVDTLAAMAADSSDYLVMTDIHPTEAGYKVIAAEFWKQIGLEVPVFAVPTKANVRVNGSSAAFEAYNINGSNYFKLRDIAMVLSTSAKRFAVDWDSTVSSIALTSGAAYKAVGGELAASGSTADAQAVSTPSKVYLDGKLISLTAYNIDGFNYFKLRDLGSAINFGVGWDAATSTVSINTAADYTA